MRMPPEEDGGPLTDDQIALLKKWIDEGAHAPDEPTPPDPRDHWAYQPPLRSEVPKVKNAPWVRNPVDAFLAADHPTHVRAFGTGFAVGVGRGGSVLAPNLAGILFAANLDRPAVSMIMAAGSLVAAGVLTMLVIKPEAPEAESTETGAEAAAGIKGAVAHGR
jgi:hypothetical protein